LVKDRDGKGYVTEDEVVYIDDRGLHIDTCHIEGEDDEEGEDYDA
jgi:predicted phosphatase